MHGFETPLSLCLCSCMLIASATFCAAGTPEPAPFINTWLLAGTFDNDAQNSGYERDWIDEANVSPRLGMVSGGKEWRYFDDRLFSRNYDDYQDLFSYFRVKRGESVAAKVAYAHIYVHSVRAQSAQLRVGADNEFKAWLNGSLVASSVEGAPYRDTIKAPVVLQAAWNRLLLKVANQENGRFGFYARLCDEHGGRLAGVTLSLNGGNGLLKIATADMPDAPSGNTPVGYREWPYVGASAAESANRHEHQGLYLRKPELALQSSDFALLADGGAPPYRWTLAEGNLPQGLRLDEDGTIRGTIARQADLGDYALRVKVSDSAGASATKRLTLTVKERPNKWYEEARLTALIHSPESMPDGEFSRFATLMKRQGYGIGMVISYNNGDYRYRCASSSRRVVPSNPARVGVVSWSVSPPSARAESAGPDVWSIEMLGRAATRTAATLRVRVPSLAFALVAGCSPRLSARRALLGVLE